MIPESRHQRFIQFPIATRLGHLATNLARISSFVKIPGNNATFGVLEESRAFIEWCAPDLLADRVDDAAQLVDIQRELTRWYWIWNKAQNDPVQRAQLAEQAQAWSDQVLEMSGLLNEE